MNERPTVDALVTRDVDYRHDGDSMLGLLCAPARAQRGPGVLLIHDAFGLSPEMTEIARRLAGLGYAVFAADVWGDRTRPSDDAEIGPLIGGMVSDRSRWMGRISAAHAIMLAQPEVDPRAVALLGYCFGGSSALEYLRTGGDVAGVISVHGGLDLLQSGWASVSSPAVRVLLCSGADDPMATAEMRARLQQQLDAAAVEWELDLYGGAKHGFTNPRSRHSQLPEVFAYQPRAAERAWAATERFLHELFRPAAQPPEPTGQP